MLTLVASVVAVVALLLLGLKLIDGDIGTKSGSDVVGATVVARIAAEEGALAPEFRAVDERGSEVMLSDLRGRAVLVNFWASWCPACRAEMPLIGAVHEDHQADGFEVIAVNVAEKAEVAARVLPLIGGEQLRLAVDNDGAISRLYEVFGLPASFFIDAEGIIQVAVRGELSLEQVEQYTHMALAGEPAVRVDEPTELLVLQDVEGPGTMYLVSSLLRCNVIYCADNLLLALHTVPATLEARGVPQEGEGSGDDIPVFVRYDPMLGGPEDIVAAFRGALEELPDPELGSDVIVRYLAPIAADAGPIGALSR